MAPDGENFPSTIACWPVYRTIPKQIIDFSHIRGCGQEFAPLQQRLSLMHHTDLVAIYLPSWIQSGLYSCTCGDG